MMRRTNKAFSLFLPRGQQNEALSLRATYCCLPHRGTKQGVGTKYPGTRTEIPDGYPKSSSVPSAFSQPSSGWIGVGPTEQRAPRTPRRGYLSLKAPSAFRLRLSFFVALWATKDEAFRGLEGAPEGSVCINL